MGHKRRQMFAETRLLMEWVADNYPGRTWHHQFRVGTDPPSVGVELMDDAERRWARNLNRRVDMIIEPPPDLVVIEAAMYNPTEKVGRLLEYLLLLPATPEARPWLGAPLTPIILTGQDDEVARVLAEQVGLEYVFYEPAWIGEFWAQYPDRRRRTPHAGMVNVLAPRLLDALRTRRRAGGDGAGEGDGGT